MKIKKLLSIICSAAALWGCVPTDEQISTYGSIYGVVSDAATGSPIQAVEVVLSPGNTSTVTGQSGHFEFTDLTVQQYRIQVSATGYISTGRQVTVVPGQSISADIAMTPETVSSTVKLSNNTLNFGTQYDQLSFSLQNIGTSGVVAWSISNLHNWFTVSPLTGETEMGKASAITVTVDRSKMNSDAFSQIIIDANGELFHVAINCLKEGSGGGDGKEDYSSATIDTDFADDITASITSLKRTNNMVVLWYTLTNNTKTENDYIYFHWPSQGTVIFDNEYSEYYNENIAKYTFRDTTISSNYSGVKFPLGIPCKGSVVLKNINSTAKTLTIKLQVDINSVGTGYIRFENVPIY